MLLMLMIPMIEFGTLCKKLMYNYHLQIRRKEKFSLTLKLTNQQSGLSARKLPVHTISVMVSMLPKFCPLVAFKQVR